MGKPAPYQSLFDAPVLARNRDPVSSFDAAEDIQASVGTQRLKVYHALRRHQPATSAELAKAMECDRYLPSRRLPELARMAWVCRGPEKRRCSVTGQVSTVWYIARPWRESKSKRPTVPAQREHGPTAKPEPVASTRQATRPATMPERALSIEERRRLREKLATEGDARTRQFLSRVQGDRGVEKL